MKYSLLGFHLLFITLSVNGQQCFIDGKCNEINEGFTVTGDEFECLSFCQSRPGCSWFTWFDDGVCTTHTECDDFTLDCGSGLTCVSGERTCESVVCDLVGACQELTIGNAIVNSVEECARDICAPNPSCEWFTFDTQTGVCFLFQTCDTVDTTCFTCISGQDECGELTSGSSTTTRTTTTTTTPGGTGAPPQSVYPNVVVLGGYNTQGELASAETFATDGSSDCSNPASMPHPARELTAGSVDGKLTIAGGVEAGNYLSSTLTFEGSAWLPLASMSSARAFSASVVTPQGWWVLGGTPDGPSRLSTTELYSGGSWAAGPALPHGLLGMCAVQLDATRTLIAGGTSDSEAYSNASFIYDWSSQNWQPTGSMLVGKSQHDCVLVAGDKVISAGGTGEFGPLDDAEEYNVQTGEWTSITSLPQSLQAPAMSATVNGEALLIGGLGDGYSNDVYILEGNSWNMYSTLASERFEHIAVTVPDTALSC